MKNKYILFVRYLKLVFDVHNIILTFILVLRFFNLNIKFDDFSPLFTFNLYISMKCLGTHKDKW